MLQSSPSPPPSSSTCTLPSLLRSTLFSASSPSHPSATPAKRQSKWTENENKSIIKLRNDDMKWEDISKKLPGRSAISCRLHYQNYLERSSEWDEEKRNRLAILYEQYVHLSSFNILDRALSLKELSFLTSPYSCLVLIPSVFWILPPQSNNTHFPFILAFTDTKQI